jgi:hypothetical protein
MGPLHTHTPNHPAVASPARPAPLPASIYLPLNFLLMNYVRRPSHLRGQWMSAVSNHVLSFTYFKAVVNTLL